MMQGEFYIIRNEENLASLKKAIDKIAPKAKAPTCVKIETYKEKRTLLQNAYLFGWVYSNIEKQLCDGGVVIECNDGQEAPYTKDILHEIFKRKYLVKACYEVKGRTLPTFYSSTDLDRKQFNKFINDIKDFCSQFWGIEIHEPTGIYESFLSEINR